MDKTSKLLVRPARLSLGKFAAGHAAQVLAVLLSFAPGHSAAQIYTILHHFRGADGIGSQSGMVLSGTTLFGMTYRGGSSDCGTVFRINTDGTGFSVLKDLTYAEGSNPLGTPLLSDGTLYGATLYGGNKTFGMLFRLGLDGSGFTNVMEFTGRTNGAFPGGLVILGSTLFGPTLRGGSVYGGNDQGTVYKVNTDGSGYTVLRSFENYSTNGHNPRGTLVLCDGALYGTTEGGGTSGCGTVFKINPDGSGFVVVKSFAGTNGQCCFAGLALSGRTLYGTTRWGGSSWTKAYTGNGVVFKIDTDGSNFAVLKEFPGHASPGQAAVTVVDGKVYGTTQSTYQFGAGSIFQMDCDGGNFHVLKTFGGNDGANPLAELVVRSDRLYGTTQSGGAYDSGVVFSISMAPPVVPTSPWSETVEAGDTVSLGLESTDDPSLKGEWFFNGTNLVSCSVNCRLVLTNIQLHQSGAYYLVASNLFGTATSAPVTLSVILAVARRPVPGIRLPGETGSASTVQYTDSLSRAPGWLSLSAAAASDYRVDLTSPLPPHRFYRAQRTGGTPPVLEFHLVPALVLSGNVGDSLRVDWINAIGPTDAWVRLDTVTLTNTEQLYFDTSAAGQPQRRYRISSAP